MKSVNSHDITPLVMARLRDGGVFLTVQAEDRVNVMTIGWALFGILWRRSSLMVAVRDSRFTFGLIEKADSFTVSVPTGDMRKELDFCGTKSGRNINKLQQCGLSLAKAQKVTTPVLDLPGYHFESRIIYKTRLDPRLMARELDQVYPAKDYHTLYFGEILACYLME